MKINLYIVKSAFFLISFICLLSFANFNTSQKDIFKKVPFYEISPKLTDSINNFVINNISELKDSCFILYINTMDSSGEVLQLTIIPQKECVLQVYDFYIDNTFGVSFIDSIMIIIYGRSVIDENLAWKTNSFLYVKELTLNDDYDQNDEYFPETIFINFKEK